MTRSSAHAATRCVGPRRNGRSTSAMTRPAVKQPMRAQCATPPVCYVDRADGQVDDREAAFLVPVADGRHCRGGVRGADRPRSGFRRLVVRGWRRTVASTPTRLRDPWSSTRPSSPSSPRKPSELGFARLLGDVAKWLRQGSAKPRSRVRFPPSPQRISSLRALHTPTPHLRARVSCRLPFRGLPSRVASAPGSETTPQGP